jgi:CRISPR/Cas system-associated endonuclease/helicase Cas3
MLIKKATNARISSVKHKIIISIILKPDGFSKIWVIVFNIPLAKRIYLCIRGKKAHKQKCEFALLFD